MSTILVFGGYGGFGARLSRRLAEAGFEVLVAGRNLERAARFCQGVERCRPIRADRNEEVSRLLEEARPALVIDAAGPFQESDYRVPKACITARIPYLDLADGRSFVTGIGRLDEAAREAGVAVISGASSVPALSGAVARHLARTMNIVASVEMGISASNRATAGRSVAAAILSYVGKPIRIWSGGRWATAFGWQSIRAESFNLAAAPAIGRRLVALADVPDLDLLPRRLPGRPAVIFRAGTELWFQNLLLWLASWPVRWGWLGSLAPLGGLLLPLQRVTARLGSDRSGMLVRVFGLSGDRRVERRWTLIATDGEGPEIPTLASVILAERILTGHLEAGARDAGELLELGDFAPSFERMQVRSEVSEHVQPPPLYARVMGPRFAKLAPCVSEMHGVLRDGGAEGRATVTRGSSLLATAIARLMRFPGAGEHDLHVSFTEREGAETWTRDFSGIRFSSTLSQDGPWLQERFGPLRFRFELPNEGEGLRMVMRGWSLAGLPLPLALAPRSEAREWQEDGRFHFDVPIALPFIGLVVHYRGWLRRLV